MIHYSWMWRIPAVLLGSLLLGWASAWAADGVVAETLDNGLRVLLLEDHRSPIVSFQVWYRVGSPNERRAVPRISPIPGLALTKATPTTAGDPRRSPPRNEQAEPLASPAVSATVGTRAL